MHIVKSWVVALSVRFLQVAQFSLRAQRKSAIRPSCRNVHSAAILTAHYLIIATHGLKQALAECPNAASQLPAHIASGSAAYDDAVCVGVVMV